MTVVMMFLTTGCFDDNETGEYSISVTATGINGSVVLQNNGRDNLTIPKNGTYTFANNYSTGENYKITIYSTPNGVKCKLENESGKIVDHNITNVKLTCTENSAPTYSVGGAVSGLNGTVVLQNNSGDDLSVANNGNFIFATKLADGANYQVSIKTNPAHQTCSVNNGSGVVNSANISNVEVVCTDNTYSVGGTASGLNGTVVLQNNSGDDVTITSNSNFTFATKLVDGTAYNVSIKSKPASQTCTLSNSSGTINGANVTNVRLTCTNNKYYISFNVHGLHGGLSILMNGSHYYGVSNNATYTFPGTYQHGYDYNVTIKNKPARQECIVYNGVGTIDASNITNIDINCTTVAFTVGGSLTSGNPNPSVVLQNNGGDDLTLTQGGSFTFATTLANGASYNVTVETPPTDQECSVSNGSGVINGDDITNINVYCKEKKGTLNAEVKDLNGTITLDTNLTHNGVSNISSKNFSESGGTVSDTLADNIDMNTSYSITIKTHPNGQICRFTNHSSGTINSSNSNPKVKLSCKNLSVPASTTPFVIKVKPSLRNGEYIYVVWKRDFMDYLYNVDCDNDGTYEGVNVTGDFKCIYDSDTEQEVSIIGNYPSIHGHYTDCGSMNHVLSVKQWGDQHWLTMENAFVSCKDLSIEASDTPDLSYVTSMAEMFYDATNFDDNISAWDVSHVQNMYRMFSGWGTKTTFNQPLNDWNVSSVTNMQDMFANSYFNQPLDKWNTSKVENMKKMFKNAENFDQNISNWDVSSVTNHSEFDINSPIEGTAKEPNWP